MSGRGWDEGKMEEVFARWVSKGVDVEVSKQIARDAPRCHPYCRLLGCEEGQAKLVRVLTAWAASEGGLAYWQGVDGLAAPLVHLYYESEATAWACLGALIRMLLPGVFEAGGGQLAALNSTLGTLQRVIAFLDPELCWHMRNIGLTVDMYAVPWLITLFSHLLPIPDVFHVWDALIVGDSLLPVFVAAAVLRRIRTTLLAASLDEALVLLTQVPASPHTRLCLF